MLKYLLLLIIPLLSSCKKDYICDCGEGTDGLIMYYSSTNFHTSQKDAKKMCDELNNIIATGDEQFCRLR